MQRRRVWRSVWQPCWQWPLWCRQQMQRCQRFRTSSRLTSIWEHASLWSLPVYWVNKQLPKLPKLLPPLKKKTKKTDSKQPLAKRFSPYNSLYLYHTKNTHTLTLTGSGSVWIPNLWFRYPFHFNNTGQVACQLSVLRYLTHTFASFPCHA